MARRRMRDILPKGLYWRTLLIIAAPAAILQLIITVVFLNDHWEATSKRMSQAVAADVALVIQLYERDPTPERFAWIAAMAWQPLRLDIALEPPGALEAERCRPYGPAIDRYLTNSLELELQRPLWYDSTCPGTQVKMRIPIEGGVLSVKAFRDRVQAASFPRVYRKGRTIRELDAAAAMTDLDDAQRSQLAELRASYERDAAPLNAAWAKAIEESEAEGQSGGAGGVVMLSFGNEPESLREARKARRDLDEQVSKRLRTMLSAAQKDRLPKAGQNQGAGFQ
jgi:hypothetical protein